MQAMTRADLLGFVEVKVGSLNVQVPIRASTPEPANEGPLARFVDEGGAYAIVVRGNTASQIMENAVREAAHDAERHLSRKLLN
jgi:hypothetical protein